MESLVEEAELQADMPHSDLDEGPSVKPMKVNTAKGVTKEVKVVEIIADDEPVAPLPEVL